MNTAQNNYEETSAYGVLCRELNSREITFGALHEKFMSVSVPNMVVARVHLTLPQLVHGEMPNADHIIGEDHANKCYEDGTAICNFIERMLVQEHPADKRFLIRYMEHISYHYNIPRQTSIGFGHDVVFSREPLGDSFKSFDNSLYVPPLTGYWAIVKRTSR
jgi:hypothetical protein